MTKTKITKIDRSTIRIIEERVAAALTSVADDLGVVIKPRGGSFMATSYTMKLEVSLVDDGGMALSREAEDFKVIATLRGLQPTDLGRTFNDSRGNEHKIVGWRMRAATKPVLTSCGGKEYCWPLESIKRALGLPADKPTMTFDECVRRHLHMLKCTADGACKVCFSTQHVAAEVK